MARAEAEAERVGRAHELVALARLAEGALDRFHVLPEVVAEDLQALINEYEEAVDWNVRQAERARAIRAGEEEASRLQAEGESIAAEIATLQAKYAALRTAHAEVTRRITALPRPEAVRSSREISERLEKARRDTEAMQARDRARLAFEAAKGAVDAKSLEYSLSADQAREIAKLQAPEMGKAIIKSATESKARYDAWSLRMGEWTKAHAAHETAETRIAELRKARQELVREAKLPIEGLIIDDENELRWEGRPLSQISDGEMFDLSTSICIALNPMLRVIFIRHGEAITKKMWVKLIAKAEAAGMDLWVASAGDGHGSALVITDGVLKGV